MNHLLLFLSYAVLLHLTHVHAIIETLVINEISHQITVNHPTDIHPVTSSFCSVNLLLPDQCDVLIHRLLEKFSDAIQLDLINAPKHLSLHTIAVDHAEKLRITTRTILPSSFFHSHDDSRIRLRVRVNSQEANQLSNSSLPILSSNGWIQIIPNQTLMTSFHLQTVTEHGAVGTTVLEIQAGIKNISLDYSVYWIPSTYHRIIFDILPSSISPPSPDTQQMPLAVNSVEHVHASPQKDRSARDAVRIIYVTSFGDVPNGQINVLIDVALGLALERNEDGTRPFEIKFLTTSPVPVNHSSVLRLISANIPVLHTPISVDRSLYEECEKDTNRVIAKLRKVVNNRKNYLDVQGFVDDPRLNKLVTPLVLGMGNAHVVHFTNVQKSVENDEVIVLSAKLSSTVRSILCDPGNLSKGLPTLLGVTGLVVPSDVARVHWSNMLSSSSSSSDIPIHTVQPGAHSSLSFVHDKQRNLKKTVVAYIGRLDRIKTPSLFVRIIAFIFTHQYQYYYSTPPPRYEFWMIGSGPLRSILEEMVSKMVPAEFQSSVRFVGPVPRSKVIQMLQRDIDIVLHTTMTNETFGLSNVEAMASGVPVISTCVGGVGDYLRKGQEHGVCMFGKRKEEQTSLRIVERFAGEVESLARNKSMWLSASRLGYEYVRTHGLLEKDMVRRFGELYARLARE